MSERGTPICIEYRDDRPFSVTTRNKGGSWSHYDIDWCKRDENLYCHWSGGGPARPFIEVGRFVGAPWPDPAEPERFIVKVEHVSVTPARADTTTRDGKSQALALPSNLG